jgi:hypothetical protein
MRNWLNEPVMGWMEVADDVLSDCFSCQYVEYH